MFKEKIIKAFKSKPEHVQEDPPGVYSTSTSRATSSAPQSTYNGDEDPEHVQEDPPGDSPTSTFEMVAETAQQAYLHGDEDPEHVQEDPPGISCSQTFSNTKSALRKWLKLKSFLSVDDFLSGIKPLSAREKEIIIEQALVLINDIYVHLPLKHSIHAVNPVQRLSLLKYRCPDLDERTFHNQLTSIFTELRDLHTQYILPAPYKGMVAFLPFLIEEFYDDQDKRQYMVSRVIEDAVGEESKFEEGVTIKYWNGIPIERAIEINGERNAGSNEYARHARGVERMTIRPLLTSLPPDEQWVEIIFAEKDGIQLYKKKFKWSVVKYPKVKRSGIDADEKAIGPVLGVDVGEEIVRRMKKAFPDCKKNGKTEEKGPAAAGLTYSSVLPGVFAFKTVNTASGDFAYIRIYTFDVDSAADFVDEFINIASHLPQNGLIIDVRGNGGGLITAAEKLLQVLKTGKIEREQFHFINTQLTLQLCEQNDWLSNWEKSIRSSIESTGVPFSQGYPLETDSEYYIEEQYKYSGPIVLVTDALCYSATDIFAAGFKDNKIGKILGVHGSTGAGGANVWTHEDLKKLLSGNSTMKELPKEAAFRVAVRRSTRVKENTGIPLEDLGVKPDNTYMMRWDDLLNGNVGLIEKAASILA